MLHALQAGRRQACEGLFDQEPASRWSTMHLRFGIRILGCTVDRTRDRSSRRNGAARCSRRLAARRGRCRHPPVDICQLSLAPNLGRGAVGSAAGSAGRGPRAAARKLARGRGVRSGAQAEAGRAFLISTAISRAVRAAQARMRLGGSWGRATEAPTLSLGQCALLRHDTAGGTCCTATSRCCAVADTRIGGDDDIGIASQEGAAERPSSIALRRPCPAACRADAGYTEARQAAG